jgi:hypothetical protein
MIRWGKYKYIRFRNCEPLCFDLQADPAEQHNLAATYATDHIEALAYLEKLAQGSIDFDAAEKERLEGEARLQAAYSLEMAATSLGNQYLMPSGKLVEADDTLYRPDVLTEHPEAVFADWPATG